MKIYAFIPARGGSKRIPRKNVKLYAEKELIYWSIKIGLDCLLIDEVFVSTDDIEISNVAKKCGAQVPFLRPDEISGDFSTDLECAQHFINWFDTDECGGRFEKPDIIVHLRPTYPNRRIEILNNCLKQFLDKYSDFDSLRTITRVDKPPYKMYNVIKNDYGIESLVPLFKQVISRDGSHTVIEPYNNPAQILPEAFWHNGYIDVIKSSVIESGSMSGTKMIPYLMDDSEVDDIDTMDEWRASEKKFLKMLKLVNNKD